MAMSRSIGGRSFTIVSPIRISPEVMDSSPATIRSVVVLPQPEGPTRTTNSRSRISRFTPLTTWTSLNVLLRFRMTTRAIWSALDRSRQARNVVLDEEGIDERHWDRAEERAGHQLSPIKYVAAYELRRDADGYRLLLGRGKKNERVNKFVPGQGKGENAGREDSRHCDRDDDVEHRSPTRRAVDACALFELARNRLEISHQQPGTEWNEERRIGQDQRPRRVAELEIADDGGERNEQKRLRHQISDEDAGAQRAAERKFQARQRIAGEDAAEQRDQRRHAGDEQRVGHPPDEQRFGQK